MKVEIKENPAEVNPPGSRFGWKEGCKDESLLSKPDQESKVEWIKVMIPPDNIIPTAWHFPKVTELRYPDHISTLRDRDDWLKAMYLDQRLSERTKLVLSRLALYLNIKTGRCDPKIRDLAAMIGLGESDSAERVTRRAVEEGVKHGWIKRHERHGGNAALYSQSNQYVFSIPKEFPKATGLPSPLATALATGQNGPTTGLPSPPRTEKNLEHKKERGEDKVGLPRGPTAPEKESKPSSTDSPKPFLQPACDVPRPLPGWRDRLDERESTVLRPELQKWVEGLPRPHRPRLWDHRQKDTATLERYRRAANGCGKTMGVSS